MTAAQALAIRRRDQLEALINAGAGMNKREQAESLLRGMDALTRRFATIEGLPLDLLARHERILVAAHARNLVEVSRFSDAELLEAEL